MLYKILLLSCTAVMVSGCGGSGSDPIQSAPSAVFSTLVVKSGGEGLGRGVTADGKQALIYGPNIADIVAGANSAASGNVADVVASDYPIVSTNQQRTMRQGTMTAGGQTWNVRILEDNNTSNAKAVFFEMPSGYVDVSMTAGTAYSNPPSGTYTYSGTNEVTPRANIAPYYNGTFTMSVNFDAQTFSYSGNALSNTYTISAAGALDTTNGRFATNSGTVTGPAGYSNSGSLYGLLHGSGGTGTSGIMYTNESLPSYTGVFVGSR